MNINIRKANMEDVNEVNKFLEKLIHDEKKYDENINENCKINKYYENFISKDNNCILVAKYNNKLVGYLYGFI